MPDNTTETGMSATESSSKRNVQEIVSRVQSLSIFFVGVGLFAAIGFGMHQTALFSAYQLTYFSVGAAIGVVGLLLGVVTR